MNPDYTIKDYEDNSWPGVSGLFKEVFGKSIDLKHFKWKNEENPQGKSIIKLAVKDDKILGLSCIWRFRVSFLGESIQAGQSVDAMVDKDHRKMGIFENMAMAAVDDMRKEDMQLRFNFPNEAAYMASLNKINIKKVCEIPQYIKILKGRKALGMFSGNKIVNAVGGALFDLYGKAGNIIFRKAKNYDIREVKSFDQVFDTLWNKVKNDYPISIERSSQYLNWRYIAGPQEYKAFAAYKNDELIGYIVAALEDKLDKAGETQLLGHIADLICIKDHTDAAADLISEAEKYLKNSGACAISCWMIKEWFYGEILTKLAFLQLRSPSVLTALPIGDTAAAMKDFIYDYKNWYVTIGDSDYI
ncbi:GNAT family N-acetyltransferase [Lutispora sp.]|uniref:GNAT family N-acetyltransferase n=1 Tax=Lutispora sp. TaxID=2828727 RepID=UPI002B20B49D|nr:GNAT family N-acetyltransferase [Lutispora sp.]MEA4961865.1 GNAT family N-acetyltransferase [Lutispora sp.]